MKAALFDLDGVLIDTEGIYSGFWSEMGRRYVVPVENFSDVIKGTTLAQILGRYFDPGKHAEIKALLKDFEDSMEYRIFPGVEDYLEKLRARGIPAAIVTSSNDDKLARLWQQHPGFNGYFSAIITDAQVQRSKPDPQGYQLAAQALGCSPEECVVFEDSYNGLEAGRRSGAKVVALATTNPAEKLAPLADRVVGSLAEME